MVWRIAINGFGRIGRNVLRALLERKIMQLEVVAINNLGPIEHNAHLLRYDSVHGRLNEDVKVVGDRLEVGGQSIKVVSHADPKDIPWKDLDVDIVLECTGKFTARDKAAWHLEAGAKRVLVSAPSEGADLTVVYGVNHQHITSAHRVISNASCTTNCLAPVVQVLHEAVGIVSGFMTTVHSYTGDQPTLDRMHKDLYRGRAAALSMIPTSTGAAKAVALVLPEFKDILDGVAIRVPTANVSVIDLNFIAKKSTSVEEINSAIEKAAKGRLKNVLAYTTEKLVSQDFNHDPHSSIFHMDQTRVMGGNFCRVLSWYDNEWGFSNRMLDTSLAFAQTIEGAR